MFERWLGFALGPIWTTARDIWANNFTWAWIPLICWFIALILARRATISATQAVRGELRLLGGTAQARSAEDLIDHLYPMVAIIAVKYRFMPTKYGLWFTRCTPEKLAAACGLTTEKFEVLRDDVVGCSRPKPAANFQQ